MSGSCPTLDASRCCVLIGPTPSSYTPTSGAQRTECGTAGLDAVLGKGRLQTALCVHQWVETADYFIARAFRSHPAVQRRKIHGYLSSQTSSIRQPLKRLLAICVNPLTYGCRQVAPLA